jgi:DNA mismatch repair protein MutS2
MDEKTLQILEYDKIREILKGYCAFSASAEKAQLMKPSTYLEQANQLLAETREAVQLFITRSDLTIGGARDVRAPVDLASHGGVLTPQELLDIKSTLIAARTLGRFFERLRNQFPNLCAIADRMPPPLGLVDAITKAISERGEVMDSASEKLAAIRRDMRIAHDRLLSKLQRIITDPKNTPMLQDALITQRDGRYVIPLRSEFKGQLRSIVHDQSSSGATLFVEPVGVVEQNNQYREAQLAERDEVRRILSELSHQVGLYAEDILGAVETISDLDVVFARAKYAEAIRATEPSLHPILPRPDSPHPGSLIQLYHARHPLLNPTTVVPIDVELDDQTYALVITGPNTGGKTVTLKTVGLLALMAQSGLHIPCRSGSHISLFQKVFADIGDEQSIEQSLSTFSGHISNIIRILEQADQQSLVILDELGAGTDPQEGAALARALLTHLLGRGITTLVTTHHPELKAYAHATPGVVNASAEFDLESLRPTYHLTIGLPGRSNALAIAQRLGMPEEIIQEARAEIDPEELRAEDLLNEIHRQRDLSRQARAAAEADRLEASKIRSDLARRLEKIEEERLEILEKTRRDALAQVKALEEEVRAVRRELARARQPIEALRSVEDKMANLANEVEHPVQRQSNALPGAERERAVRLGDKVRVASINMQGIVTTLGEEDAEVQVGSLRIRTRLAELQLSAYSQKEEEPAPKRRRRTTLPSSQAISTSVSTEMPASPGLEIDLRGQRVDDALDALERYLDSAYLAGLPFVRIIHGKGTGKLRQVVRETLAQHAQVKGFEAGSDKEGGDGVTIAKLRI